MIKFFCAHCGKEFQFKSLPIPEGGAAFQCSECGKTSNILKKGNTVFSYSDEDLDFQPGSSTLDMSDSYRAAVEDELSPHELEARLQGLFMDLPFDFDILIGVVEGPDQGMTYPFKKPCIKIGKTGCDITLNDAQVSPEHCQIEVYGNQMTVIRDLQSTGGTFRNGFPTSLACLRPGDRIHLGKTTLLLIQNPKKIAGS
jgi:hypothetical protein